MVGIIVLVPKKDRIVRMCIDFKDLNKASPKGDYPLPHIDILVVNALERALFSLIDVGPTKLKW